MPGKMNAPAFTPLVLQTKDMIPINVVINETIINTFSVRFITIVSLKYSLKLQVLQGRSPHN